MAGEYNSSVKFDSSEAERGINSLTGKITGLKNKLGDLKTAAKGFDASWTSANRTMTTAATKANQVERGLTSMARGARSAERAMAAFTSSLNTGEIAKAAGIIRSLGTHLTTTATRMRQMRVSGSSLGPILANVSKNTVGAALAFERLGGRLDAVVPKMQRATREGAQLAGIMGLLGRTYKFQMTGLGSMSTSLNKVNRDQRNLNGSMQQGRNVSTGYQQAIRGNSQSLLDMGASMIRARNLAVYLVGGLGIRAVAQYADSWNLAAARLQLVTDTTADLVGAQKALLNSANMTRTSFTDNARLFVRLAQAGEAYGMSMGTALRVTENVNKAFQVSGATTQEAATAAQQLSQAFASGRFQGDELRTIFEAAPRLSKALADSLGVNIGQIREMAKEGKIGVKELTEAFSNPKITKELTEEFARIPVTISGAFTVAENRLVEFIGKVDKAGGISQKIVSVLNLVSSNFEAIGVAAGIAGTAILLSYVPSVIRAIKVSAEFIKLNIASYLFGVRGSFAATGASLGLMNGVFKKSATSTLPHWKQVVGNVGAAVTLNLGSMLKSFRNLFLRIPVLAAVGTAALYAFSDDTRISARGVATTNDYLVTGFQIAYGKIAKIVGSVSSWIVGRIESMVDQTMWALDKLYRGMKYTYTVVKETFRELGDLVPGGDAPEFGEIHSRGVAAMNTGVREDFASAVEGTAWQKAADRRAHDRYFNGLNEKYPGWLEELGGGSGVMPPPDDDEKKKKKGKKSDKEAREREQTIKRLTDEIRRMEGAFDETEAKRQEFEDGLITLNDSMKYNIIDASKFDRLLRGLANNTFPGLRDEIKALKDESEGLQIRADGGTEAEVDINTAARTAQIQIDAIDTIIAKQGDVNGVLEAQKRTIHGQVEEYGRIRMENLELEKIAQRREEHEQNITEIIDNATQKLQENFTSRISDMLSFNSNSFKNFFKGILGMAKDTFAEILSIGVFVPMQDKIRGWMKDAIQGVGGRKIGSRSSDVARDTPETVISLIDATGKKATAKNGVVQINVAEAQEPSTLPPREPGDMTEEDIVVSASKRQGGFFQQVVQGYKSQWKGTADLIGGLGKSLERALPKLGLSEANVGKLARGIGRATAGAQMGASVAGFGKMLGIKTSTTGGTIGGAVGGATGIPGMDIVGSIVGSLVGGMLKKTKSASVSLSSGQYGNIGVGTATGSKSLQAGVSALGKSVKSGIQALADSVGATVVGGINLGSIGMRKDTFRVDPTGRGATKLSKGAIQFKTEEEAIEFMIKNAIQKGILTGLSATSDRVLRTFQDTDRAVQIVTTLENIKKQAASIRNPVRAALDTISKDMSRVLDMFREAGASAEDYADLQLVVQNQMNEVLQGQLDTLRAFRDDLIGGDMSYKSSSDRLKIADTRFADIEGKISRGEAVDQGLFTSAGSDLSSLAREVYGSTPEFKQFQDRLIAATEKLMSNVQSEADKYKPMVDAINASIDAAKSSSNVTNALLETIARNTAGYGGYGINNDGGGRENSFNQASF